MKKQKQIISLLIFFLLFAGCNLVALFPQNEEISTQIPPTQSIPTDFPTPTAIPTAEPFAYIELGETALQNGNWDLAIAEFEKVVDQNIESELTASALLGLGKTYYQIGDYEKAIEYLAQSLNLHPAGNQVAPALFTMGLAYGKLSQNYQAIEAFSNYLLIRENIIDYYVHEIIGDNYYEIGDFANAITSYQAAISHDSVQDPLSIVEKIGDAYQQSGDGNTAIVTYQDVINQSGNDYTHAYMNFLIGDILFARGEKENAYTYFHQNVDQFPLSYYAYLSLISLLENDQPVDEYQRGLVDYFANQDGVAIEAFDRYLDANAAQHPDAVHFYKGLSLRNVGETQAAIDEWTEQIDAHYNENLYANAIDEISYTQWVYLDDTSAAIDTLLEFIEDFPEHQKSSEFLYLAGRMAEGEGDLITAAYLWQRLGFQFSATELAYDGLFQSGIAQYRLRKFDQAIAAFQGALGLSEPGIQQAAALFWMGKSHQAKGSIGAANNAFIQAVSSDPTGYYSIRADYYLNDQLPFSPPALFAKSVNLSSSKKEAEDWLIITFGLDPNLNLAGAGSLANDPRMVRGTELWSLGLLEDARSEFESLRIANSTNAENTYRLANFFTEIGLYRSGIIAARQVLNLAGFDDKGTLTAPRYFTYLRFGFYYQDLLFPIAEEYQIDPFLLYSIIRQESLFEGFITSSVGARGLMQIMPATGEEIYGYSGWPQSYSADDLYRPYISITFGAEYLNRQRNYFDGDIYAMLAAYNGGAGNATNWLSVANQDPDLFTEVIRFEETRRYIRSIFELYEIYSNLYQIEE